MKILKHGKKPSTIKKATFECDACGCIWIADVKSECKKAKNEYYAYTMYICDCPECGEESITNKATYGSVGTVGRPRNL